MSDDTPRPLPVFPLTGALLLPDACLPLHIFEPRYRNMVRDALAGSGEIGLLQPREVPDASGAELYDIGCVGEVEQHERFADGRYLVLLRGTHRFRARHELALHEGYRRFEIDDIDEQDGDDAVTEGQAATLIEAVKGLATKANAELDLDPLDGASPRAVVHTLAVALPFSPAEKQALLECATAAERCRTMLTLFEMGFALAKEPGDGKPLAN